MYPGAHALTQSDKPALIMAGTGKTITYAELNERSSRLAQWWYALGAAEPRRGLRTATTSAA